MDNYKIHRIQIKNSDVSVEVQNLLISAGLKWNISKEPRVEHPYGYPIALFIRWKDKEYFCGYDSYAENITVDELRQLINAEPPKDPALISGAEALRALADGKEVERKLGASWCDDVKNLSAQTILHGVSELRLKPQTIKLELELPNPFDPNEGDEYFYISTLQHCLYSHDVWSDEPADITQAAFGAYRTEEEIKQVVEQLRKIRGTNS